MSPPSSTVLVSPRATVSLGPRCTNRCRICGIGGGDVAAPDPAAALRAARAHADAVTFVGGEPTLHEDLPSLVAMARELGFRAVGVQTNGAELDVAALAAAGLTDVHLTLHSARAEAHDWVTDTPGSFALVLRAMGRTRSAGLPYVVTTVLTRSTFRSIAELPPLLASRGARGWAIEVPHVAGRAQTAFDSLSPRLALAIPRALHAIATAHRVGLPAFLRGAPLCLLGPHAEVALRGEDRHHPAPCESCPARAACPGIDPVYAVRFGGDELRPPAAAPAGATATGHAAIAELFVGAGALARPADDRSPLAHHVQKRRLSVV